VSTRLRDWLSGRVGELRHEPTAKRIRAMLGGTTVVDSTRAVLVWEPRRVVPSYAVPESDLRAELVALAAAAADAAAAAVTASVPDLARRPVLDPSVPFAVHTADGEAVDVYAGGVSRPGAGFRAADPDLGDYVVLDFAAFDGWLEEDEPNLAHPRDPFHRIDVLPSSRHVRIEVHGQVLADSYRPTLLFETLLPTRYYLPREDVIARLRPSELRTQCAYKGQASYWSCELADAVARDLAWSYQHPLHEASRVRGLVAFFDERVDVVLDGSRLDRPATPWSGPAP